MTIYLVYKTTNLINGKYYIGKHRCKSLNDNYLGSGVVIKEAVKKYGKENFQRETLAVFDTEQEAYDYESKVVDVNDPMSYNVSTGGKGGHTGAKHSKESVDRMKSKLSETMSGEGNPFYGKNHTSKTRKQMSKSAKARGWKKVYVSCLGCRREFDKGNFVRHISVRGKGAKIRRCKHPRMH